MADPSPRLELEDDIVDVERFRNIETTLRLDCEYGYDEIDNARFFHMGGPARILLPEESGVEWLRHANDTPLLTRPRQQRPDAFDVSQRKRRLIWVVSRKLLLPKWYRPKPKVDWGASTDKNKAFFVRVWGMLSRTVQ